MSNDRGPTWSEEFRHECEVSFICSLPSRAARKRYFDGWTDERGRLVKPLAAVRGEAAVQRLRADVRQAWAHRHGAAPSPQQAGRAPRRGRSPW